MPGDPKECRERAARCLNLAAEAANEGIKQTFLNIARHWQLLAEELEGVKKLMDDEKGALKLDGLQDQHTKSPSTKRRRTSKKLPLVHNTKRTNGHTNWDFK